MRTMAVSLSSSCYLSLFLSTPNVHNHHQLALQRKYQFYKIQNTNKTPFSVKIDVPPILSCYYYSETSIPTFTASSSDSEVEEEERESGPIPSTTSSKNGGLPRPVLKKRKRYRKEYPGESKGITEEMRFVAMKLRNDKGSRNSRNSPSSDKVKSDDDVDSGAIATVDSDGGWEPSLDGFLKYLVDSKLVFETVERVVEDSNDVSYAYFRRTGLERSEGLAKDLEWFSQQDIAIPEPSISGVSYAAYLKELSERSAPLFLSHFYNVYFSHIAGGEVIAKQVAEKLLKGRDLEFYKWEGDVQELIKEVREKLNSLGENWSRDDKNKCLKETTKSFRYLGQIVRLIIL